MQPLDVLPSYPDLAVSYLILPEKISRQEEEMQKSVILGSVMEQKPKTPK